MRTYTAKVRGHPTKERVLRQLVDAAMGTCEPEDVEPAAVAHSRAVLKKRFAEVLYPNYAFTLEIGNVATD